MLWNDKSGYIEPVYGTNTIYDISTLLHMKTCMIGKRNLGSLDSGSLYRAQKLWAFLERKSPKKKLDQPQLIPWNALGVPLLDLYLDL